MKKLTILIFAASALACTEAKFGSAYLDETRVEDKIPSDDLGGGSDTFDDLGSSSSGSCDDGSVPIAPAYDAQARTYYDKNGGWQIHYDGLSGLAVGISSTQITSSVSNVDYLTGTVIGSIGEISHIAHAFLSGNQSSSVQLVSDVSHLRAEGALSIGEINRVSHATLLGTVTVSRVRNVGHLYVSESNMAQFIGKEICSSWIHIF